MAHRCPDSGMRIPKPNVPSAEEDEYRRDVHEFLGATLHPICPIQGDAGWRLPTPQAQAAGDLANSLRGAIGDSPLPDSMPRLSAPQHATKSTEVFLAAKTTPKWKSDQCS